MTVPVDHALRVLDYEFEEVVKLFSQEDWKFYKFGLDGPYKRYLTKLTKMSNEMDTVLFNRFGTHKDNASFNKLIVLCLDSAKEDSAKECADIETFRQQIKRMRRQI